MRVTKVCSSCGGTNVFKDAAAEWNEGTQEWELKLTTDDADWCESCDAPTEIEEEELPE